MKVFNVIITGFLSLLLTSFTTDCYLNWLNAYESATEKYNENMIHCENATWSSLCRKEAEKIYSNTLESAGDTFYDCVS